MDEKGDCLETYQAFHLGLLVAARLRNECFDIHQHLRPALEMIRGVASNETTIYHPQEEVSKSHEIAELIGQTEYLFSFRLGSAT